ncbi:hypothetical protein GOBAR_AA17291 [Gossypium barbadense]|uniref:Uncharacterized protein n=1 Tax=Gossypium barbadense TaxID=3634 RepID=A0A2P5XJ63_GOSBA|nr:hypothetical protein GOBAR_AA17291 [Gossypium barbadense]
MSSLNSSVPSPCLPKITLTYGAIQSRVDLLPRHVGPSIVSNARRGLLCVRTTSFLLDILEPSKIEVLVMVWVGVPPSILEAHGLSSTLGVQPYPYFFILPKQSVDYRTAHI